MYLVCISTCSMVGRSLPADATAATPRTPRPTNTYFTSDIIDYIIDCSRSARACAARPRACFISIALITYAAWVLAATPLPAATCRYEDLLAPAAGAPAALVIHGCHGAAAVTSPNSPRSNLSCKASYFLCDLCEVSCEVLAPSSLYFIRMSMVVP